MNRRSVPATRRGTSLIEILVVLVILVVGILSIVRLFPAGFIALRNAENNTFADRLANGALEQLKKTGNGLPEAIYMYVNNGYDPNYSPTDYSPYAADATYNDINKQRYISNETITVPATRMASSTSFLPLYVLDYGPISLPADLTTHGDYLKVISVAWTPQTGDSRPNPSDPNVPQRSIDIPTDILQAGQQKYLVDYNGGAIAVPQAAYNQVFYVQVTRQVEGIQPPVMITVPATVGTPTTDYDGNWFSAGNVGLVTGAASLPATTATDPWTAVTLYRPFRCVASTSTSPTFTTDPYEFAVYSPNIGTDAAGTPINPGVLAFNPLASGRNGTQPLQARISYMVLDWHVLHEDHDVSSGDASVRLILGHLKKIGDVQFDQTTYTGVVPNMTTPGDIMMLDLDTGAVTTLNTTNVHNDDDNTGPAVGNGIYAVTYQNGRVTLPANNTDGTVRTSQHLRFFYAGDADWALAVQKAASVYTKSANATTLTTAGSNTPNLFYVDPTDSTRVYFPLCDAGKTVEFDGVSYTDKNGATQQTAEGTAQISTDTVAVGGTNLVYVNLTDTGLNSSSVLTNADTTKPVTFQAVRGISAQAVVIWHERNNWRSRTIDTLLTQTQ